MAIGDRIRIISEEEFRIMSPPRRPRGEPPATTIRLLRRHLAVAQHTIEALRLDRADKEKVIAGYDVQLSEAQDQAEEWRGAAESRRFEIARIQSHLDDTARRLAYLEGYHAKSQEEATHRQAVLSTRAVFQRDPAETHPGGRPGNPQGLSAQRQAPESTRQNTGSTRLDAGLGHQVRREHLDDQAPADRRPVEHVKITERGPWMTSKDWTTI